MKKFFTLFVFAVFLGLFFAGTANAGGRSASPQAGKGTPIRFLIWGEEQKVAYERSLAEFAKVHPEISVDFQMLSWDDYWSKIQTEFAGGVGPDVFMNQTAYFKTLQAANAAEPLNNYIQRDKIDTSRYDKLALDIYSENEKLYILPKDFDSIALIYNKDLFDRFGVSYPDDSLSWNPQDGGSFLQLAKRMTRDINGNDAASPQFDHNNIAIYGFLVRSANQTLYWNFIRMNGGDIMNYSDPKTIEAVQFLQDCMYKYYVSPPMSSVQSAAPFESGIIAMETEGSWNLWNVENQCNFNWGTTLLPKGPSARSSVVNSVGPSVYAQSKYKEEAWQLVKWIGSDTSQKIFAESGVVFTGLTDGGYWDIFVDYWAKRNRDIRAFLTTFQASDLFLTPMVPKYNEKEASVAKNIGLVFTNRLTAKQAGDAITADFIVIGN
jgi:multiple sugar transport system substrate-binding protein